MLRGNYVLAIFTIRESHIKMQYTLGNDLLLFQTYRLAL